MLSLMHYYQHFFETHCVFLNTRFETRIKNTSEKLIDKHILCQDILMIKSGKVKRCHL